MRNFSIQIILIAFFVTIATCETFGRDSSTHRDNSMLGFDADSTDNDNNLDKRVERYAFGLGRRAYTYTTGGSGVKRLPVYNFGLGKRGRPYSFGLGKRTYMDDDYQEIDNAFDNGPYDLTADKYDSIKRGRPYSFGLGKRDLTDSDGIERRSAAAQRYNFGLGRR